MPTGGIFWPLARDYIGVARLISADFKAHVNNYNVLCFQFLVFTYAEFTFFIIEISYPITL